MTDLTALGQNPTGPESPTTPWISRPSTSASARTCYRGGRVEPHTGEILPHWKFKTVAEAKESSATITKVFLAYLKAEDFLGADLARKFLQMGWTRARRYVNHEGGRKCGKKPGKESPRTEGAGKAVAAAFYERYAAARQNIEYVRQKQRNKERYESQ